MKQVYYILPCKAFLLIVLALFLPLKGNAEFDYFYFPVCDTIPIGTIDSITHVKQLPADSINNTTDSIGNKGPLKAITLDILDETNQNDSRKLNTYVFTDSAVKVQRIFSWRANSYFNSVHLARIDTLMSENKTDLPFYKKDVGVTYLGPTGSATLLHNYFNRTKNDIFSFFEPYYEYTNSPDRIDFYSVKTPYSDLGYFTSGNKRIAEDNLKVLFTTNVLPALNFGLSYNKYGAKGIYQNQATKDKSFTIFSSYIGKRYVAHGGYIYNGIDNKENGGIINDYFIVDTIIDAGAIETNLKTAKNKLRSNTYFLTHSFGIPIDVLNKRRDENAVSDGGSMFYFGHSLEYSRYNRVYTDTGQDTVAYDTYLEKNIHYYDNYYLSKYSSSDSSAASQFDNKLFIRLQPWSSTYWISNIDGGIGYQFENYYYFHPSQYLSGKNNTKHSIGYIYGGATGIFSRYFKWDAFLKYHFSGYRQNDLYFDVTAKASVYPLPQGVHLQGRFIFDNREPGYFTENYYSNHVKWDNNFDKTQETKIQASLSIPDWDLEAGFNNALVNKLIYYGLDALPKQSSDVINITSIYLQKNFKLWLFHFDHRLLMQITSDKDIMPLPLFSGNVTYYLQSEWVKNVLNTQIGLDVYYNTKFYDYAYNPAVGMFHTQNEKKLGGYPWVDLFANFKWKRANIFVKFTNTAGGIVGNRDYFSAYRYPRNNRMLRIGVRWHFFT